MRCLVTGANGFIGSNLARGLLDAGHDVRGLVQPGTPLDPLAGLEVETVEGDLRDAGSLQQACVDVELIYHLAAIPSDWAPKALIDDVNLGGTERLVVAALEQGCRRLVHMSTLAVHASTGHRNATEDTPRDRDDLPYATSKRAAEDRLLRSGLDGRLERVVIRPGLTPFGPGDRLFSLTAGRAMQRLPMPLIGGGQTTLCTAYVENLVAGVVLAGDAEAAVADGEIFIIGDDGAPTWWEFFDALARAVGGRRPLGFGPPWIAMHGVAAAFEQLYGRAGIRQAPPLTRYRVDLMRHDFHFSSAKARRLLGYRPRVDLETAAARTAAWINSM